MVVSPMRIFLAHPGLGAVGTEEEGSRNVPLMGAPLRRKGPPLPLMWAVLGPPLGHVVYAMGVGISAPFMGALLFLEAASLMRTILGSQGFDVLVMEGSEIRDKRQRITDRNVGI